MDKLKVSIITVVANGALHIEKAIKSVLGQDYQNIEYIIIDKESTDGTLQIINKYKHQLTLVSEDDKGIYDAMNKGIARASGELIGILNSDDWYEPHAVSTIVAAYREKNGCSVFHGLLAHVDAAGQLIEITGHHHSFLSKGMIEHPTCFVHRKVYENLKFDTSYAAAGDYDLMLRVVRKGYEFHLIDKVIANFRHGGISSSFKAAKETLAIQSKYALISNTKKYILMLYFWFKSKQ